jgi:D-amino-acid oxidase
VRVLVVGAGVLGLSCAVRLWEAGYEAHVLARDLPPETTSAVAAALWYPYRALPRDLVATWSRSTYARFARLATHEPEAGVRMRWGTELLRSPTPGPWWGSALPDPSDIQVLDRAPHGYAGAWRVQVPVADTSIYLPWLLRRLQSLGGTVTRTWLPALPERGVVVNCAGLAAGQLADDDALTAVRGQVVYVEQTGLTEWWLDQSEDSELTYVVPREHDIVVGGTAEEGSVDLRPDPRVSLQIMQRASRLVPQLATARRLGQRVGLRPARTAVRLETVRRDDGAIVHCYGHGGAGITLSWGCAGDVVGEVHRVRG